MPNSIRPKAVIIVGSSRHDGNTQGLVDVLADQLAAVVLNLNDYKVAPYDYHGGYKDDFSELADLMLDFDTIYLATPMYWYSASAQMKTFLDRWTDLLQLHKSKGQKLRGKRLGLLATGANTSPPSCFEQMFQLMAQYLGMAYLGMLYCSCPARFNAASHESHIDHFLLQLNAQ